MAAEPRQSRVPDKNARVAKPIDAAGELYQRRALEALPIAGELGMTNPLAK
jgi:hypothetical protein